MPARKAATKKPKRAGTSMPKSSSRKPAASKKTSGTKRKVSKTKSKSAAKSSARKVSKKKPAARKKVAARKPIKKKSTKKTAVGKSPRKTTANKRSGAKKAAKAAPRKASGKKKSTTARKSAARKKVSAKKSSIRKRSVRKPSVKKPSVKKVSKAGRAKVRKTASTRANRSRQDVLTGPIHGIEPYSVKRGEDYMSPAQLAHFQAILTSWKRELMNEVDRTVHHMQDEAANFPDPNDRATQESEFGLELRTRDRERKLLRKIDAALVRIEEGTYGYCDETGEEIGLKRLEARPVATLSVEAQERREMAERQFRDRDDRYR